MLSTLTQSWSVVVASTTALLRHNLPHAAWVSGISAFTSVFATIALWLGALLAAHQKAL